MNFKDSLKEALLKDKRLIVKLNEIDKLSIEDIVQLYCYYLISDNNIEYRLLCSDAGELIYKYTTFSEDAMYLPLDRYNITYELDLLMNNNQLDDNIVLFVFLIGRISIKHKFREIILEDIEGLFRMHYLNGTIGAHKLSLYTNFHLELDDRIEDSLHNALFYQESKSARNI
jgi:hypothetical protein